MNISSSLRAIMDHPSTTRLITGLILLNAVTLGLETHDGLVAQHGALLSYLDRTLLSIFTLELTAKLIAYRRDFVKSGWNWFDLIIVTISWLPSTGALSVLRALRVLRILRLLSVVPQMRRVIAALGHSIPGMGSVVGVLLLVFYIAAVLATKLFGSHPDPSMQAWFGDLGASAYTLFQIMTLESWSMGIVRPTMEIFPLAWVFFLPFIIITSFAVLNLFIGIIVDAMQMVQQEERAHEPGIETVTAEIAALRAEIRALRSTLKQD
ncbi:MAG: ion transporter [Litorivicinaceae bacterium]|jgi:voltage-gated sodium channel|nr:ion transporter [Litorivicinaceae bacterium]MDP5341182.1 ion transporter [Litorivicinaceae bacterium]MDP5364259.1 ion transporter [Litorivicinaceae bacterium]